MLALGWFQVNSLSWEKPESLVVRPASQTSSVTGSQGWLSRAYSRGSAVGGGFPGSPGRINVSYEAANHLSQSPSDRELRQILLSRAMLLLNYLALCWGDALIIC